MIKRLLDYAKKLNLPLEVFCTKRNEVLIDYLNDNLKSYEVMDIKKYLIKSVINNSVVTLKTEDISNPEEIIRLLKESRELNDELNEAELASKNDLDNSIREEVSINPEEVKNNLKSLIDLKQQFKEIQSIHSSYNFEKLEYELCNTTGTNLKDYTIHGYYYADVNLNFGEKSYLFDKFLMDRRPDFQIFKSKLINSVEESLLKANSKSVKTDKYNLILSNKCVFDLLDAFALDFHAETINKGNTAFANKFNEKVFSDLITIIEDPANQTMVGSRMFDEEGTKTSFKKIIDKGVFKTKLYNKKYAKIENAKSTGNSFGVRNLYLEPGNKTSDELLQELNDGVYIDNLMGIHSGINHLTGDLSLQCEGFIVSDGKKTTGLNQAILATNIFELFNNVKAIANDLEFFGSRGGAPSMLIENVTIAGKEV